MSLAIHIDEISFQIILAKPALTAILGHYTAYILKNLMISFFAPIQQKIQDNDFNRNETNASRLFLD